MEVILHTCFPQFQYKCLSKYNYYFSGTVCISMTLITSAASPYLFKYLPYSIRTISLAKRCTILFVSNAIFLALMGSVDVVLERDQNGKLVFVLIFVLRSLQGYTVWLIFQIVQVNHSLGINIANNCQRFK